VCVCACVPVCARMHAECAPLLPGENVTAKADQAHTPPTCCSCIQPDILVTLACAHVLLRVGSAAAAAARLPPELCGRRTCCLPVFGETWCIRAVSGGSVAQGRVRAARRSFLPFLGGVDPPSCRPSARTSPPAAWVGRISAEPGARRWCSRGNRSSVCFLCQCVTHMCHSDGVRLAGPRERSPVRAEARAAHNLWGLTTCFEWLCRIWVWRAGA